MGNIPTSNLETFKKQLESPNVGFDSKNQQTSDKKLSKVKKTAQIK